MAAGTIANGAVCTTAATCITASACCTGVSLASAGTAISGVLLCWAPGVAKDGTQVPPATGTTIAGWTSPAKVYSTTACAAAAGSSTLAVSAAAAATALYAMY